MSIENFNFQEKMEKVLENPINNRHSFFQLKYFVIGKQPTMQAKLHTCLTELQTRKSALDAIKLQIEDTEDNIELADLEISRLYRDVSTYADQNEKDIYIRKAKRKKNALIDSLDKLKQTYKEQQEEAEFFLKAFLALSEKEPLKDKDDLQSQLEYWNEKYLQIFNMRLLLQLPIDTEMVQCILALPEEAPIKKQVLNLLENQHKQLLKLKVKDE